MKQRGCVAAFGAGVAAAVALAGVVVTLRAQNTTGDVIVVCVGPDRVFRAGAFERPCAPGEQRYLLAPAKPDIDEPKVVGGDSPTAPRQPSEARIKTLEEQVKQLERELVRSRDLEFKLPFVLVDQSGKPAFTITQTPAGPMVELLSNGRAAVQFGFGPKGNARVAVLSPQGAPAAALGVTPDGIGAVIAYDGGRPVASLLAGGPSGPAVGVGRGEGAQFLAALLLGNNGGKLELSDNSGMVTADGGVLRSGSGAFRVRGQVFAYLAGDKLRLPAW